MKRKFDAVILGAGAAGLMCAAEAGKRGRRVAVVEHGEQAGRKILISGGGRCNFTNLHCRAENFLSANPHFAKSALARYTPGDFLALVEKYGIGYHEKTLGQLFCDGSAREILEMLEEECRAGGVEIFVRQRIREVRWAEGFMVRTAMEEFAAPVLVVATGGLSIPKMGATGLGYEIARQFGLKIVPTRPGLVPLTLAGKELLRYRGLAGVSAEVVASVECAEGETPAFREKMLFTHRGLSGPAILQISSYWKKGKRLRIDLAPGRELTAGLREGKTRNLAAARRVLQEALPQRLAEAWLEAHKPRGWSNEELKRLEERAHGWTLEPSGTEGYEKAEVTAGGVDTEELSSKTMESRKMPGLYFIGEVVDVTGQLGGYNFQWAWASGAAAGRAL